MTKLIDCSQHAVKIRSIMCRSLWPFFLGLLIAAAPAMVLAQNCRYQGIYEGKALIRVNGQPPAYFPSRLTVLPDGHSIIATSEVIVPLGAKYISTSVLRGSFDGNVFIGSARERFNVAVHQYASTVKIRFIGNQARLIDSSATLPAGYVHDPREDQERIYYRIRS
jgi:hypothetical protein